MITLNTLQDGFHTKPLKNGFVEFRLVHHGKQLAGGYMSPAELANLVANLLNAAHNAFHLSDKTPSATPVKFSGEPVSVMRWIVGGTNEANRQALIIEVGEAPIAFIVPTDQIRELARYLISASHHPRTALSPRALLRNTFLDFWAGLRGCGGVLKGNLKESLRLSAMSISARLSRRSLRLFQTIAIIKGADVKKYKRVGKCIYCDNQQYSKKPGLEDRKFGAEHIVPEGLGGTLELPESSCQDCETSTGALVEGDALGRTLKALRVHLGLKKAGKGPHPKELPLSVRTSDGSEVTISDVPIAEYPIALMLPTYLPPEFAPTAQDFGKAARSAMVYNVQLDMKALQRKYDINGFATASWNNAMLCRMLAKIGHSLAVAELGEAAFRPLLRHLIADGAPAGMSLIGCSPEYEKLPRSKALHTVGLGYQRYNDKDYVVASVRLFASYGAPIYRIVVGESLEAPIAKFTRVLASKISRTVRDNARA